MDYKFLEDWERQFYKEKLIRDFPHLEDNINSLNDYDLMNIYNSENRLEMFNLYK